MIRILLLTIPVLSIIQTRIPIFGDPPSPRKYSCSVYDQNKNRLLFFSGVSEVGIKMNDVYSYSLSTNEWELLYPSTSTVPEPRLSPSLFFDAKKNRLLVYGGKTQSGISSEWWSFDLEFLVVIDI